MAPQLLVDRRAGSKELVAPLKKMSLPAVLTDLEFGDIAFEGRGEKGYPVMVGIEFKKLSEFVQSIRTQRLQGHQLIGMRKSYDYAYLFIEGDISYNQTGQLIQLSGRFCPKPQRMRGQMGISELLKRLFVLHLCGGLNPWLTRTRKDTLQSVMALYRTWTDQDLDEHKSHIGIYVPPSLIPVSSFRRVVAQLPGIGIRASLAVEKHFKQSLPLAFNADAAEWADIMIVDEHGKTRRLGTATANRIVDRFYE
jgi:hypothetical protein